MTAFTRRDFPDGAALAPAFAQWTAERLAAGECRHSYSSFQVGPSRSISAVDAAGPQAPAA